MSSRVLERSQSLPNLAELGEEFKYFGPEPFPVPNCMNLLNSLGLHPDPIEGKIFSLSQSCKVTSMSSRRVIMTSKTWKTVLIDGPQATYEHCPFFDNFLSILQSPSLQYSFVPRFLYQDPEIEGSESM